MEILIMSCSDPGIIEDKEIKGSCTDCGSDINEDDQAIEDFCSYSPLECDKCGFQPCDWSC